MVDPAAHEIPPSHPDSTQTDISAANSSAKAVHTSRPGLSPSRAADFTRCPLLYRFRVIDRLPEPRGSAAIRGSLVHSVLEHIFDAPAADRTVSRAKAMVGPQWDALLAAEPEVGALFEDETTLASWLETAQQLVEKYFSLEDPTRLEPAERELYVETTLDNGMVIRGYVDRLDEAPNGALRIVDYKTGKAPSPRFEQDALFQMRFYALVLWKTRGIIPAMLQLVYLGSQEVLRYQPTESELRATERRIISIWSAIEEAARTGEWRTGPSKLCDWCAFHDNCPEYGGTPPPIPTDGLKRILGN